MDKVCELVGRLTKAPQVFVYKRTSNGGPMAVLGGYGFLYEELDADWHLKEVETSSSLTLAFPNVADHQILNGHPLLSSVPRARSLVALLIPQSKAATTIVMMIVNPASAVFTEPGRIPALALFAQIVGASLPAEYTMPDGVEQGSADAAQFFAEDKAVRQPADRTADQSAAAFLLRTLPSKPRMLQRNGVSYTAVRAWRSALKRYQIDALRSLKEQQDTDSFARIVGNEIADAIVSQIGKGLITQVVPIPGGSSARSDAFSVRVAHWVAEALGCRMEEALSMEVNPGSSHPCNSAKLHTITVTKPLQGVTLVVDDVISSGKHMELAIKALRDKGIMVFAIGWIAA